MSWNESAVFSLFVNAALKSTAVLALAWLVALALRHRSAAARHLVWTGAAAAVIALPLLSIALPAVRMPGVFAAIEPGLLFQTTVTAQGDGAAVAGAIHRAGAATGASVAWRPDWMRYILVMWAAGALVGILQLVLAALVVTRIRRSAIPFGDANHWRQMARSMGIHHAVDVLQAAPGTMPMTFGMMRSAILLPADAAEWTEERRRVVLLHELAHVRRADTATHVLARVALSLNWWNPLAWTAWQQFLKERECATDDLVLQAGARASDYAGHLLEVARTMQSAPAMGWAAIAMAKPSQLEGRLLAILDPAVNRTAPRRASALVATLVAVASVAPLAALQAQDNSQAVPPDVDATIRAAMSQKNHEMLENAAAAFEKLRQFDTAQKLLESAVAIRAEVSGQQSVDYGLGLLRLGELEQRRNQDKSAEDFFQRAAQILGNRPEAARALLPLGISAFVRKDYVAAVDRFQQAQSVDPSQAGTATMWIAVVREREKNFVEAEAQFKNALALQNSRPADASTTRVLYAQFLRNQGRFDEAAELDPHPRPNKTLVASVSSGSGVYRVGGGISAPVLMYKREPEYSEVARAAKFQGTVTLYVEVGPDGVARNLRVLNGLGMGLDEKAIDAVSQWQFRPGMKDGKPVTVAATIEVNFRLL